MLCLKVSHAHVVPNSSIPTCVQHSQLQFGCVSCHREDHNMSKRMHGTVVLLENASRACPLLASALQTVLVRIVKWLCVGSVRWTVFPHCHICRRPLIHNSCTFQMHCSPRCRANYPHGYYLPVSIAQSKQFITFDPQTPHVTFKIEFTWRWKFSTAFGDTTCHCNDIQFVHGYRSAEFDFLAATVGSILPHLTWRFVISHARKDSRKHVLVFITRISSHTLIHLCLWQSKS